MSSSSTAALASYGLDGRQLAVLPVLAACEPASQQQAAGRLGKDARRAMIQPDRGGER